MREYEGEGVWEEGGREGGRDRGDFANDTTLDTDPSDTDPSDTRTLLLSPCSPHPHPVSLSHHASHSAPHPASFSSLRPPGPLPKLPTTAHSCPPPAHSCPLLPTSPLLPTPANSCQLLPTPANSCPPPARCCPLPPTPTHSFSHLCARRHVRGKPFCAERKLLLHLRCELTEGRGGEGGS